MRITDILNDESVRIGLKAKDKNELLELMMDLAEKSGKVSDKPAAMKEILERESIMSTGVGKGIALPHAKTNAVEDSIGALAVLDQPVDFESLDGKPVRLVFLIIGRENNVGSHLRLLSKISRLMNNESFRNRLLACASKQDVFKLLDELESEE